MCLKQKPHLVINSEEVILRMQCPLLRSETMQVFKKNADFVWVFKTFKIKALGSPRTPLLLAGAKCYAAHGGDEPMVLSLEHSSKTQHTRYQRRFVTRRRDRCSDLALLSLACGDV